MQADNIVHIYRVASFSYNQLYHNRVGFDNTGNNTTSHYSSHNRMFCIYAHVLGTTAYNPHRTWTVDGIVYYNPGMS